MVSRPPTPPQHVPPPPPEKAASPSLTRPPSAHIEDNPAHSKRLPAPPPIRRRSSSFGLSYARRPGYLDTYARPSIQTSTSVSASLAQHPDLAVPHKSFGAALESASNSAATESAQEIRARGRGRSMSAGSLRSLLNHDRGGRAKQVATSEEQSDNVDELSWSNKWWPFAVVGPNEQSKSGPTDTADGDGAGLSTSADSTSHNASRSFLSLFAGKKTAEQVAAEHDVQRAKDEAEGQLLDAELNDVEAMTRRRDFDTQPGSASTTTQRRNSSSPTRLATSYSPASIFASGSAATSSALEGPTAFLSSLSLNPFKNTSSSPGSSARQFSSSASSSKATEDPHDPSNASIPPSESGVKDGETDKQQRKRVEPLLDDEDQATSKQEQRDDLSMFHLVKERYEAPKLPLVMCHGLFGFDVLGPAAVKGLQVNYWVGVKEAIEAMGGEVLIGRVPASASIEERAKVLCSLIEKTFPGREVNLIGHSMGGLDGRFLISRLQPTTFKVRSLVTISTPHRGSTFADFLLEDVLGAERVPALLSMMSMLGIPGGGKAFDNLTTTNMARFNDETPDDPSVKYYSFGAEFEAGWSNPFRVPWGIIAEREGPNDGLVSVESAKWGEYKGTLENVNHLDLIGWKGSIRFAFANLMGTPIQFRPVSFYSGIAEMLAKEGF